MEAVPILLRRTAQAINPNLYLNILPPIRVIATKILKEGELEHYLWLARSAVLPLGAIILLLDCEDNCPATLAPQLLARAKAACPDVPVRVVLAYREFETWFLFAADSLRGQRGLSETLMRPANPYIRDAKGWLNKHKLKGDYSETLDQPALTARFDFDAAREADSFDKWYRDIASLMAELQSRL